MTSYPLLITGGNGQLGGAMGRVARAQGIFCEMPGRSDLDLADPASIHGFMRDRKWRAIVNCAAYTAVDKAESEPHRAEAINATAPGFLAEYAASQGIGIYHVSTDYVFDGTKSAPYTETDPVAPLGVYGRSKAVGEDAVRRDRKSVV